MDDAFRSRLALVVACVLALWAPEAAAQSKDAEALVDEGVELRREGRDAEALARFERAYELQPSARALAQIGLAEQALGRWVSAHGHLVRAIAEGGPWIEEHREALGRALSVVRDRVGRVSVHVDAPEARVAAGGRGHPTGRPFAVEPGAARLVVSAPGRRTVERSVSVSAGEHRSLELTLPERRPSSGGDGAQATTPGASETAAGRRDPTGTGARGDGGAVGSATTGGWVLAGSGALLLASSAVFGGLALREQNDLDSRCGPSAGLPQGRCDPDAGVGAIADRVDRLSLAGWAVLGAGVAALAVGITWLALADDGEQRDAALAPALRCARDGCVGGVHASF